MKSLHKNILIAVTALLVGALLMYLVGVGGNSVSYHALEIWGDVESVSSIGVQNDYNIEQVEYDGVALNGISLEELINDASPLVEDYDVLFFTTDGLYSRISGDDLSGCYIVSPINGKNGWEAINTTHPISSNMKWITRIAVVSNELACDNDFSIITQDQLICSLSPGNLLCGEYRMDVVKGGESSQVVDGKSKTASQYNVYKTVDLEQYIDGNASLPSRVLVLGEDGGHAYDDGLGDIRIDKNSITYVFSDGETLMKNARGILLDPPQNSITDATKDAIAALGDHKRAMIIVLDGVSYNQYVQACDDGQFSFIKQLDADKASSVFTPVTNAGLSAILTGVGPDENGVWYRQSELLSDDVFKKATDIGKTSVYVEGDKTIVNTSITPSLNTDLNGDGTNDDEVFEDIMDKVTADESDLYVVHFHGVDDAKHAGDVEGTNEALIRQDGYVKQLVESFDGQVIIVADHGMHMDGDVYIHGRVLPLDLIVPYIIVD